jgi:hypothetical protein
MCDVIIGKMGESLKYAEIQFTPDSAAYVTNDALQNSPMELKDILESDNGYAYLKEATVLQADGTALVKKGFTLHFFSSLPGSTAVASNSAENISVTDQPKWIGSLSFVTADFVDTVFTVTKSTFAIKTSEITPMPILYNKSSVTDYKKSIWVKIVCDEAQDYAGTEKITIKLVVKRC